MTKIIEEFNAWLSPKVERLSRADYSEVLAELREEIEMMRSCVKEDDEHDQNN